MAETCGSIVAPWPRVLKERIDALEQELEDRERSLRTTQLIAVITLGENQEYTEEKLGLQATNPN